MLTQHPAVALPRPTNTLRMSSTVHAPVQPLPKTTTSHPSDPIPEEPQQTRHMSVSAAQYGVSPATSSTTATEAIYSDASSVDSASTPRTDPQSDDSLDEIPQSPERSRQRKRRASTLLVSQNSVDVRRLLGDHGAATEMIQKVCCGGGCCMLQ